MRLSPVALVALHDPDEVRRIAAEQSRTMHAAPQAVEACIWFAGLLRRAILGEPKASLLAPSAWDDHATIQSIAAVKWRGRSRARIRSSGYMIHTLEAALWLVEQTDRRYVTVPSGNGTGSVQTLGVETLLGSSGNLV
jgi:ADP-ribosyl-[dinitrogen reductase] hydrolase